MEQNPKFKAGDVVRINPDYDFSKLYPPADVLKILSAAGKDLLITKVETNYQINNRNVVKLAGVTTWIPEDSVVESTYILDKAKTFNVEKNLSKEQLLWDTYLKLKIHHPEFGDNIVKLTALSIVDDFYIMFEKKDEK